jgi:hypothetical protein
VRALRDEVFALRRDKAVAEAKETDVRRELAAVRAELDGMSGGAYRTWQRENSVLRKQVGRLLAAKWS